MKVEARVIQIQLDVDEWKKIQSEYDNLRFEQLNQSFYKCYPNITLLFDAISTIENNRNHKIDKKI